MQNTYGIQFLNKTASRLNNFWLLNRSRPDFTPRRLDPLVKADNDEIYQFYSIFYEEAEKMTNAEFARQWFSGEYLQKYKGKVLTIVNGVNQQYWKFSTDEFPFVWYEVDNYLVPGID